MKRGIGIRIGMMMWLYDDFERRRDTRESIHNWIIIIERIVCKSCRDDDEETKE